MYNEFYRGKGFQKEGKNLSNLFEQWALSVSLPYEWSKDIKK